MLTFSPFSHLSARLRYNGAHRVEWTITIPSVDIEIDVLVEFDFRAGHPGRLSGPAEDCFPPEADEVEIISVVGLHSGVCCMEMLERERVPMRYYGIGPRTQTLMSSLVDDMAEQVRGI